MKINDLIADFSQKNGSYIYTDFYEKSPAKIALIAKTSQQGEMAEQALSKLLETFKENFYPNQYDTEKQLRKTATEIHWALSAFLHTKKKRFEISLIILAIKNNILYVIQAGRLVVVSLFKKPEIIGLNVAQLCDSESTIPRIGSTDGDFNFKIYKKRINPNERFLILPVFASENILSQCDSPKTHAKFIQHLQEKHVNPLLSFHIQRSSGKKYKKRFNLTTNSSARILAAIVIIASLYVLLGRKLMQGWLSSGKEFINEQKIQNINIEQILIPNQSLVFKEDWKWNAPEKITLKPHFDSENIYLICDNEIFCIKKNTFLVKWNQGVDSEIYTANLLRRNVILIFDLSGDQYLLSTKTGLELWKKSDVLSTRSSKQNPRHLEYIDFIRDGRLEKNYFVEINAKSLSVYSADNGKQLSSIEFKNEIGYVSDYDYIEKCFYVTFGQKIVKIKLLIN
ncbi:MAG: hypothetical protein U9P79_01075 [Candidatus Cloacimonadota bacterium]|nr:hypothetical protein [Candidatus Cloacimonadota bacterium]